MKQTLQWANVVDTKHGDALNSWPLIHRRAASRGIERMKQDLREKYGEVRFVSQESSCTPYEGKYGLLLKVVVDV